MSQFTRIATNKNEDLLIDYASGTIGWIDQTGRVTGQWDTDSRHGRRLLLLGVGNDLRNKYEETGDRMYLFHLHVLADLIEGRVVL